MQYRLVCKWLSNWKSLLAPSPLVSIRTRKDEREVPGGKVYL